MKSDHSIDHAGIVTDRRNGVLRVNIQVGSACSACSAKGACGALDSSDRTIDIEQADGDFQVGDRVRVRMKPVMGYKAVLMAYLLPFVVLLLALILLIQAGLDEGSAGLGSLGLLAVYFVILRQMAPRLKKQFAFEVEKYSEDYGSFNA